MRWTNYLMAGGRYIGIHVENSDETTVTRYFHTDHLGSIAVITREPEVGLPLVVERLSYDAWGVRRNPDGQADPSGSIASEASRGFTGHEHLEAVGLIHMNGRVYDPLLGRFGTPDPMTEDPFSTQGWNRYAYVGNSPLNFTDPSGYCFLGCFWKPLFKAIGSFFKQSWRALVQLAATALICGPGAPLCAGVVAFAVTGVTSGDLGLAMRAGLTAFATAFAFKAVGDITGHTPDFGTSEHLQNIAGHALVGCGSAVAQGNKCGPGALSGAVGSFASPLLRDQSFGFRLVATSVLGGTASVAAGGNFGNGALMAAFGYLFNEVGLACGPVASGLAVSVTGGMHCGLFVYNVLESGLVEFRAQFTYAAWTWGFNEGYYTTRQDYGYFWEGALGGTGAKFYPVEVPAGMTQQQFDDLVIYHGIGTRLRAVCPQFKLCGWIRYTSGGWNCTPDPDIRSMDSTGHQLVPEQSISRARNTALPWIGPWEHSRWYPMTTSGPTATAFR